MPIDIQTILNIFTSLRDFLNEQDKKDVAKNERLKTALKNLMTAANETRAYLSRVKIRVKGNAAKQSQLSTLWIEASVQVLEFNEDLAKICNLQGKIWSDPKEWTQRDIDNAKRQVRVIDDQITRLLAKQIPPKKKERAAKKPSPHRKQNSGISAARKKKTTSKRSGSKM